MQLQMCDDSWHCKESSGSCTGYRKTNVTDSCSGTLQIHEASQATCGLKEKCPPSQDGLRKTKERTALSDYSFCGNAAKLATIYLPPPPVRALVDAHFDAAMEAVVSQPLQWSLCSCQRAPRVRLLQTWLKSESCPEA
ncbi:unnamed protein product [Symbiodinium natans]|uniref:Uncharacterized protein n=1 Tax=Symbiodinium natans TaxID=878477 RepID=A0A812SXX4_9DINO|nr:unnamed protein product [Symbiodinium natans]